MNKLRAAIKRLPFFRSLDKINTLYYSVRRLEVVTSDISCQLALQEIQHYGRSALTEIESGINETVREKRLVVSMTTYGERINSVHLAIESLMLQTVKADEIVLWLSESEFSHNKLPEVLKRQQRRGLNIRFCEELQSYKKLIPSLQHYPEDLIITVDDDFIYPYNHVERLYSAYCEEPDYIHCARAHYMELNENRELRPYDEWGNETEFQEASLRIFPTGAGAILYFPGCFDDRVMDHASFLELCPTGDDIWFKFMSLFNGTPCKVLPAPPDHSSMRVIPGTQQCALWSHNKKANDIQIKALLDKYSQEFSFDFK